MKGKTDTVYRTLFIHRDDIQPNLCHLRHLLTWIFVSRIKGGFIFPSTSDLTRLQSPEFSYFFVAEPISYSTYSASFKSICSNVISREGKWNSHSGRKTFYLLSEFGGCKPFEDAMRDAGHTTVFHAMNYRKDAGI